MNQFIFGNLYRLKPRVHGPFGRSAISGKNYLFKGQSVDFEDSDRHQPVGSFYYDSMTELYVVLIFETQSSYKILYKNVVGHIDKTNWELHDIL